MDVIGVNVAGVLNWMKLTFAKCVVERAFNEFIDNQMSELYLLIYKKSAQNPNCDNKCFQTVHKKDEWCASCVCLKDEVLKLCRHKQFSDKICWKSFEYDKLMSSSKELTKIFLPDWNKDLSSSLDLSSILALLQNCKRFDMIPINIIQGVKNVRNKYFAHNPTSSLSEYELKKCLNRLYTLTHVIQHTHSGQKAYQDLQDVENLDVVDFLKRETNDSSVLGQIETVISLLQDAKFQEQMQPNEINIVSTIESQIKQKKRKDTIPRTKHLESYVKVFITIIFFFLNRVFKKLYRNILTPTGFVVACFLLGWMLNPLGTRNHERSCASMKYSHPWNSEIFFEGYYRDHINFIGRKWFYDDLERYILNSTKGIIVTADMGYGKTALVANILCSDDEKTSAGRIRNQILAFHMCKFDVLSTQKPAVFIRNIVGKIAREIPEFGNIILMDNTILQFLEHEKCSEDPYACIDFGLIHPLSQLSSVPRKVLLLIEALDECCELIDSKTKTIVKILHRRMGKFPKWLTFVFISRNISSLLGEFSTLHRFDLDSQDKRNVDDIKKFIHTRISHTKSLNDYKIIELEEKLTKLSKGNFLFVIHALQHWAYSSNSSINDIPLTLGEIYQNNFERAFWDR